MTCCPPLASMTDAYLGTGMALYAGQTTRGRTATATHRTSDVCLQVSGGGEGESTLLKGESESTCPIYCCCEASYVLDLIAPPPPSVSDFHCLRPFFPWLRWAVWHGGSQERVVSDSTSRWALGRARRGEVGVVMARCWSDGCCLATLVHIKRVLFRCSNERFRRGTRVVMSLRPHESGLPARSRRCRCGTVMYARFEVRRAPFTSSLPLHVQR